MALLTCSTRIPAAAGIMHTELHLSAMFARRYMFEHERRTDRRSDAAVSTRIAIGLLVLLPLGGSTTAYWPRVTWDLIKMVSHIVQAYEVKHCSKWMVQQLPHCPTVSDV